ncbi:hypothetical protein [Adlercreutzia sp. ZJ242]|uniref:hypothetical protein n=1 Tax=Adlercreutzia sp. ZJ242 TaxID=2709409 RepID=UPI0013EAC639|nr:hypothetical protein [Adlercreutzia sp. ZJ242]
MKASEFKVRYDSNGKIDELEEFLDTEEGRVSLKALDAHWAEVMALAERYGFITQAYGGVATLATHEVVKRKLGTTKEVKRLRMCNTEMVRV